MEGNTQIRGRGIKLRGAASGGRRPLSKNKHWIAGQDQNGHSNDSEKWDRGGHRRGRGGSSRPSGSHPNKHLTVPPRQDDGGSGGSGTEDEPAIELSTDADEANEPELNTAEERERFYQELVKARDIERKRAIAEGKMDDPLVPKKLTEAITMVGTCMDMAPRFERYRRERENNLDKWEVIPGTKRVDHKRAVKIYERAAGDKTLPSDLRPPPVLKKTLDYLFHDLLMRGGFSQTYDFIRDRSRAVRNDFTMQHETGQLAMECHDRCARFHILALHLERDSPRFSVQLEEQQLMNTLQSLKEFYDDQRGRYQSPTELEMRVYHRLIHIRDQRERSEAIPESITNHPVFQLTSQFRLHVQAKSAPITKTSALVVDQEGMQIFAQLASVLREQNNLVMIYLVACILERLFGKDTIEDLESIRGNLSIPNIIDGISAPTDRDELSDATVIEEEAEESIPAPQPTTGNTTWGSTAGPLVPSQVDPSVTSTTPSPFGSGSPGAAKLASPAQPIMSAFGNIKSTPNAFGNISTFPVFGGQTSAAPQSAFASSSTESAFAAPAEAPRAVVPTLRPISSLSNALSEPSSWGSSGAVTDSSFMSPSRSSQAFAPATPSLSPPKVPSPFDSTLPTLSPPKAPTSSAPTPSPLSLNPMAPAFSPSISQFSSFAKPPFNGSSSTTPIPQSQPPNLPLPTDPGRSTQPLSQFVNKHVETSASPSQIPSGASTPAAGAISTPRIVERRQTLWELPSSPMPRQQNHSETPPAQGSSTSAGTSPVAPPPLGKVEPISLPPTPTARWFDPGSQNSPKSNGNSALGLTLKQRSILNLQMPTNMSSGMLSPLRINSPNASFIQPNSNSATLLPQASVPDSLEGSPSKQSASPSKVTSTRRASSKGKAKATEIEVEGDLKEQANRFLRRGTLVKKYFQLWLQRAIERAAWAEACRRGDEYKAKLQRERLSSSVGSSGHADKRKDVRNNKRRVSLGEPYESRRVKRRVSNQYESPITDDELARRLRENHEENERRWAQGSFLQSIRARVQNALPDGGAHPQWRVWLSLNPENDGTAIWLEHKFDLPTSGIWISETIFSMPIYPKDRELPSLSPGLIIFERTPLGGIRDDLERKYRILDDCARLRDVIKHLAPAKDRHFHPILCTIIWEEEEVHNDVDDFTNMTRKLIEEGTVKSALVFPVSTTTKDLDKKFQDVLAAAPLDVEDILVQTLTWKELTRLLTSNFKSRAMDWLESCWINDTFNELRFEHVMESITACDEAFVAELMKLLDVHFSAKLEIPPELRVFPEIGRGYGIEGFVDAHVKYATSVAAQYLGQQLRQKYTLPSPKLHTALRKVDGLVEAETDHLQELWSALYTDGAYGRGQSIDISIDDADVDAESSSPVLSDGNGGTSASPPPSTAATSIVDAGEKSPVTIAMLRALTKDILRTYRAS